MNESPFDAGGAASSIQWDASVSEALIGSAPLLHNQPSVTRNVNVYREYLSISWLRLKPRQIPGGGGGEGGEEFLREVRKVEVGFQATQDENQGPVPE